MNKQKRPYTPSHKDMTISCIKPRPPFKPDKMELISYENLPEEAENQNGRSEEFLVETDYLRLMLEKCELKTLVTSDLMGGPYSSNKVNFVHSNTPVFLISLSLDEKWGRIQCVLDKNVAGWIQLSKLVAR